MSWKTVAWVAFGSHLVTVAATAGIRRQNRELVYLVHRLTQRLEEISATADE